MTISNFAQALATFVLKKLVASAVPETTKRSTKYAEEKVTEESCE